MNCPQCGYEQVPSGARFCPACGETMPQAPATGTRVEVSQDVERVEGGSVTGVRIRQVIGNVFVGAGEESQARRRRHLRILLDKVRSFWVDGVLARSIEGADLIPLGKRLHPGAVEQPWEGVVPEATPAAGELPTEKPVAALFGELGHALLVLDGVGSGKTVTLLDLAREAVDRAEQDPLQPIPVVLNLSSWTDPRQSIAGWVVAELNTKYQIPTGLGRQWLADNDLTLLLDGLDEVDARRRPACIAALNQFRQDHGLVQIGVCSRTEAYEAAGHRLKLSGAILLEPLTAEQIDQYLAAAGPGAAALRTILQEDTALQALARSPLMLNMMRRAYQGVPLDALRSERLDSAEERRALLLDRYVERMFGAVAGTEAERYPRAQTTRWLAWLARGMERHGQNLFLIEHLQPSWLPGRAQPWLYALLTRLIAGLALGLSSVAWGFLLARLRGPAWGYLLVGAVGGLLMGVVDGWRFELRHGNGARQPAPGSEPGRRAADVALAVLLAGLASAAIYWLRTRWGIIFGLKEGLMFALMFGLVFGSRNRSAGPDRDTRTVEALAWSPAGSVRGALLGVGTSLLLALAYGLVAGLYQGSVFSLQHMSIFFGTFAPTLAVIGVLLGGLQGTIVEGKTLPNQGTWLSARNALLVGVAVGVAGGLTEGLVNVLAGQIFRTGSTGLITVVMAGLFWGIVAALWYGGLDVIKHLVLRAMLWLGGHTPRDYARFLDYAVERIFLQRAGGGYLFANRLLQGYFAGMDAEGPAEGGA
jgi:hypothetical protein